MFPNKEFDWTLKIRGQKESSIRQQFINIFDLESHSIKWPSKQSNRMKGLNISNNFRDDLKQKIEERKNMKDDIISEESNLG